MTSTNIFLVCCVLDKSEDSRAFSKKAAIKHGHVVKN